MSGLRGRLDTLQDGRRWLAVRNDSGEAIPALAVMEITGVQTNASGAIEYLVTKPTATLVAALRVGDLSRLLIGAPRGIPKDGPGSGTMEFPAHALADPAATFGTRLGVTAGEWALTTYASHFVCYGSAGFVGEIGDYASRVVAPAYSHCGLIAAKPDADVTSGSSGTFSIYSDGVDTGENVTAHWKWATDALTLEAGTESWIGWNERLQRFDVLGGACGP